jgi:hypothetical protein
VSGPVKTEPRHAIRERSRFHQRQRHAGCNLRGHACTNILFVNCPKQDPGLTGRDARIGGSVPMSPPS